MSPGYVAQLVKIASVCRLWGSSVAYNHHRVALFGKKRQPGKTSIKDKRSVNYNVELWRRLSKSHVCEVQAESWKFRDGDDEPHEV